VRGFDTLAAAVPTLSSRGGLRGSRARTLGAVTLRSLQLAAAAVEGAVVASLALVARPPEPGPRWQWAVGRGLRAGLARLGATFIKVGQIASTREDLLPLPIARELAHLQERAPRVPFARVRAVVESQLGGPLAELFDHVDVEPLASGSVAQVHRGRTLDGHDVAIKVRRPEIAARVSLDRAILLGLARAGERLVPTLRLVSLAEAVGAFCDAVELQLDLALEAAHNRRFQADFADAPEIRFPRLVPERCSEAVLTMELLPGVHERDLDPRRFDYPRIVATGMRAVCAMIFEHGFVHADLHPGNLRFEPPATLGLLDLGLVGELDDEDRRTTAQLLHALASGDGRTVARLFFVHAPHHAVDDYAAYEREIAEFVAAMHRRDLRDVQLTREIGRIFDILRRHRIQARSHLTIVNLALLTAEGMGKRLAPELQLTTEALPYLVRALALPRSAPPAAMPLRLPGLTLRPVATEDVQALQRLFDEPTIRRFLFDGRRVDAARTAELVAGSEAAFRARGLGLWLARADGPDEPEGGPALGEGPVGFAGFLFPDGPTPDALPRLVYGLLPAWRGRGLATRMARRVVEHAFDEAGETRVGADVDEPNAASVAVLERLGMRRVGRVERGGREAGALLDYEVAAGRLAPAGGERSQVPTTVTTTLTASPTIPE